MGWWVFQLVERHSVGWWSAAGYSSGVGDFAMRHFTLRMNPFSAAYSN